jgi:hypothetical protein
VIWMLVAAVIAAGAVAIFAAIIRLGREIPRALDTLDEFGRQLEPALVRVRTATDDTRSRTPRP